MLPAMEVRPPSCVDLQKRRGAVRSGGVEPPAIRAERQGDHWLGGRQRSANAESRGVDDADAQLARAVVGGRVPPEQVECSVARRCGQVDAEGGRVIEVEHVNEG